MRNTCRHVMNKTEHMADTQTGEKCIDRSLPEQLSGETIEPYVRRRLPFLPGVLSWMKSAAPAPMIVSHQGRKHVARDERNEVVNRLQHVRGINYC